MRIFQAFAIKNGVLEFQEVEEKKTVSLKILNATKENLHSFPKDYTVIKAKVYIKESKNLVKIRILGLWNTLENSKSIVSLLDETGDVTTYFAEGKIKENKFYEFSIDETAQKITILVSTILEDKSFSQTNCYEIEIVKNNR
ncbi:MAG: hypothetical protein K940chlam5_00707 [Candidatus Anoxychlamydiales bacterium]|nr:hypothetical protein [Candidatus Anoxychlamydiales bacterium]